MHYAYGERETAYLTARDPQMGALIARTGFIAREVEPDLFTAVVRHIVSQQISSAAQRTVWMRLQAAFPVMDAAVLANCAPDALRAQGLSGRKVSYIQDFARQVLSGTLELETLHAMRDEQVIERLCALRGLGVWTAEMLLIFSLQRPDVFSLGDFGIRRGICRLHGLEKIDKETGGRFRALYSPYGTVASFYLWEEAARKDA